MTMEIATLAGGCFWCLEAVFDRLQGVQSVESGYIGGKGGKPTYEEVCGGKTGHAEAVRVTFDPGVISYADLLEVFFAIHDPTTLNRQGNDVGTQYRSAIFFHSPEQERIAGEVIADLARQKAFDDPIVTEVVPIHGFHPAEAYHQGYYQQNQGQPYCRATITPKMAKLRAKYAARLKPSAATRTS
jgi:peptide-methionine (S)-S-oxide reductase